MTDSTAYEFKITETRVFEQDESDDGANSSDAWQQHAAVMTQTSADGWELVSTQVTYTPSKLTKAGRMAAMYNAERRALTVWRRPTSS